MENRIAKFTKIPLRNLIDTLIALYDGGANYVDIMGETGAEQDEIGIAIREEYMATEEELGEENREEDEGPFNAEDLNNLI